jgi:riboflavin biosynthesis pyrimidine reductase
MPENLLQLYPSSDQETQLKGLYLAENLRNEVRSPDSVFVYANFVASLDGRIAIPHPDGGLSVPATVANARDWRLFQELAVQADILLSSGRYLRDYAEGRAQEILRVYEDPTLSDLAEWREEQGFNRHPAIAVLSASLDFPVPAALIEGGREVVVLTTEQAPSERKSQLKEQGLTVLIAGHERVEGHQAIQALQKTGYHVIYSAAGPKVLHMLLQGAVLNRLYLTLVARLLAGDPFSSIIEGPLLQESTDLELRHLYLDPLTPGPGGQLFTAYDVR